MQDGISRLKIDDVDFLVASLIARCPRDMMLRELVMNAMEAAVQAPEGARRVDILAVQIDGVRKLALRNTGPGLSREQLHRMCDLGASIGKAKGLDANFGVGAKVASLGSNPAGVRYRSCHNGRVHQVILAEKAGTYGRIWQRLSKGGRADIADVTEEARAEGLDTAQSWTEVVLFGARLEQDTVAEPHGGMPTVAPGWIRRTLFDRFYQSLSGVEIHLAEGLDPAGAMRFVPIEEQARRIFAQTETVQVAPGLRLHYSYQDPAEAGQEQAAPVGRVALLRQGEMYDVQVGSPWAYNAPLFGVPFAARQFTVLIELQEGYPVLPEQYRQFLFYAGGNASRVTVKDFAAAVRSNRPGWLRDLQARLADAKRVAGPVEDRLNALLGGLPQLEQAAGVPKLYLLRDMAELRERWLDGRAARYLSETNELFVNACYPPIACMADRLCESLPPKLASQRNARALALNLAEEAALHRLAGAAVRILARACSPSWTEGNRERALSSEALSLVTSDLEDWLVPMQKRLVDALREPAGAV